MLSVLSLMGANIDVQEDSCRRSPSGHDHSVPDHEDDDDLQELDHVGMTKAEIRKSNKPIMEKRRRARINTCLNELKSLILDALKKDPSRHSKLEKADILEMTVKHLQAVQRQQLALAVAHDPSVLEKFKGGFTECAQEITRYISRIDGVDAGVRQRLMQHLSHCTGSLNATTPLSFTAMAGVPLAFGNSPNVSFHPPHGDLNNNQARLLHRLVAARLAAAGDTTGAALLLQGGLSLLARGGTTATPPPPPNHPTPASAPVPCHTQTLQPSVPSNNQPKLNCRVVNEGASSSRLSNPRVSAFTAVRRGLSPPRIVGNPPSTNSCVLPKAPKILTPRAIRPVPHQELPTKTLVQAQVALKPVSDTLSSSGDEVTSPLDFSFRKTCAKRSMEDAVLYQRPAKVLKVENSSPTVTLPVAPSPKITSPPAPPVPLARASDGVSSVSISDPMESKDPTENPEVDERDMWRPW